MLKFLDVIGFLTFVFVPSCLACTCSPNPWTTPKEVLYCDAYYVIKGAVVDKVTHNNTIEYYVQVENVFKGGKEFSVGEIAVFKTGQSSLQCGVNYLEKGSKYLFTGPEPYPNYGHGLTICQWVRKFTQLSREEKKGIRGDYKQYCPDYL